MTGTAMALPSADRRWARRLNTANADPDRGKASRILISNDRQPPKLNATGAAHRRLWWHHTLSSVVRWGQNRPRVPHQVGLADVHCQSGHEL